MVGVQGESGLTAQAKVLLWGISKVLERIIRVRDILFGQGVRSDVRCGAAG